MNILQKTFTISLLAVTSNLTVGITKPLMALDFNFSFGSDPTEGTITGLVADADDQLGTVTITNSSVPAAIGTYANTGGTGFNVDAGGTVTVANWSGLLGGGANNLTLGFAFSNLISSSDSGFGATALTITPLNSGGGGSTSVIPFEFSTTPGLIVLGGIFGISHLLRKVKNKQEQEKENKKEDRQDIKKDYQ